MEGDRLKVLLKKAIAVLKGEGSMKNAVGDKIQNFAPRQGEVRGRELWKKK